MAGTNKKTSTKKGVNLIQRRLPGHDVLSGEWEFFCKSYLGGLAYIDTNLFQYFKEGDEEFARRKARAYRENHCRRIVDLINSYLFKKEAVRDTTNTLALAFHDNIDGKGKSIAQFMKIVSQWASVFGRIFIVVDKPKLPEEETTGTQKDNINPKAKPYCYVVFPQDVLDYSLDEYGDLKWILIREYSRDDESPFNHDNGIETKYRLWMPGVCYLFNDKGIEIDTYDTGLKIVPILYVDNEAGGTYSGTSLLNDIAYLDRSIFNNWSRLDVIVNEQTFSQLIFPIEGLPPEIIEDTKLREKFLQLAVNRVILYSASAGSPPAFISPDASQADFILRMIERQVKQLYSSLGMENEVGEHTQQASGVAKAYDFDKLSKLLASKADNLEEAETKINKIFSEWISVPIEVITDYPDEFDVRSLADELAVATELVLLNISESFMKEVMKAVVRKAMPKLEDDTMKTIMDEIDAKSDPDETKERFDFDKTSNENKKPKGKPEDEDDE